MYTMHWQWKGRRHIIVDYDRSENQVCYYDVKPVKYQFKEEYKDIDKFLSYTN